MEQNIFSSEMINNIVATIGQNESEIRVLVESIQGGQEPKQAAVNHLMGKYDISEAEAAEIINDLDKGIQSIDSQVQAGASSTPKNVREMLAQLTADYSDEQTHNCYANILTALQLLDQDLEAERIEQGLNQNLQKSNEELMTEIEALWDSTFSLEQFSRVVKDKLDVERLNNVVEMVKKSKHEYRLMTAVWLYTAQRDGKIKLSDSEVPITSMMLGALAGAGVETLIATSDLAEGKITLAKWQVVMKYVFGALMSIALLALSALVIGVAGLASIAIILSIIGTNLVGIILASIAAIGIAYYLGGKTIDWGMDLLEWFDKVYDHFIVKITAKIKSIIAKIKEWLTSHKRNENSHDNAVSGSSGECESETEAEAETGTETATEAETTSSGEEEHRNNQNEEENPA